VVTCGFSHPWHEPPSTSDYICRMKAIQSSSLIRESRSLRATNQPLGPFFHALSRTSRTFLASANGVYGLPMKETPSASTPRWEITSSV